MRLTIPVERSGRLRYVGAVAAITTVAALVGCSSPANSGENSGGMGDADSGNVNFVYKGSAATQAQYAELFELFRQEHPDIYLNARGIAAADWPTFANTVATQIAGGAQIDIVQVGTEGQRLFASKDILEPLDTFIEQDQDVVDEYFSDLNPNVKEWNTKYGSTDGTTYYMPGGFNTMVLYCNASVFDDAGATLPEKDWSWDEFRAAAEQIKEETGAYMIPGSSGYFTDVMPWLTTNGASTFDADWETATFDTPEAVEAAEFAAGLAEDELVTEPGGSIESATMLAQGELACVGGGRWPVNGIRTQEIVDQVRVVNWPTNTTNGSPVGWDGWPITKSSQNKQAAWTFIKFLMSKDAGEYFATGNGGIVPARDSVATSDIFLENSPEGSTLLSEALSFATPLPSIDRGAEAQKVIEETWLNIIAGNAEPASALADATEQLNSLVQ